MIMERILSVIKNKYIIATVVFAVWMLFFDRHDVTTQYGYYSELKSLEAERDFYIEEMERINQTVNDIHNSPEAVQRIARERYQMKKDNEDVFVIIEVDE